MSEPPVQRAVAVVDRGAVERNCARLVDQLGGSRLCAVVKADGYGHGAIECARAALAGGATWLAVAAATEAVALRRHLPNARILTMGALTEAELDLALGADSDLAAWREDFADLAAERGAELGVRPRVHVKYDTGMGRLGERDPDAVLAWWIGWRRTIASSSPECGPTSPPRTSPTRTSSTSSSGASARSPNGCAPSTPASWCTPPTAPPPCGIRLPTSTWLAAGSRSTASTRSSPTPSCVASSPRSSCAPTSPTPSASLPGPAPATAGGGARPADTWVGVLPIGYGDGVRRGLTNNGEALVGGTRYPLVGTISMDNVTVDLGPSSEVEPGSPAVLIGAQGDDRILCEEVARRLDTINYEITCGIGPRVPRVHVGSEGR